MKLTKNLEPAERKAMRRVFWRSYAMNASRTGATQYHACGFLWSIMPIIDLFYKDDPEGRKKAMVRHTAWFNATLHLNDFIVGLVASMEKQNSQNENFDDSSITAVKASLMGPLSGIGDSFFWGILRVVAAGIGISLASAGSAMGAIVFLLLYNIPAMIIQYYSLYGGYSVGTTLIERLYESGGMKILTKVSSLLGLMMMGSMTASNVKFKTILQVNVQGSKQVMKIQTYLDQLFVGIVPLAVTLVAFWLLYKKHVNINWVMLGIMVLGIVLGLCGIC